MDFREKCSRYLSMTEEYEIKKRKFQCLKRQKRFVIRF